jgi:hypothetical protein
MLVLGTGGEESGVGGRNADAYTLLYLIMGRLDKLMSYEFQLHMSILPLARQILAS